MTTGLKKGDKLRVTGNSRITHIYDVGDVVYVTEPRDSDRPRVRGDSRPEQFIHIEDLELIEEEDTMAEKRSNPKNFRNGDVIKVGSYEPGMTATSAFIYVKFGENYYNLSQGGQMKACRYLPPGTKEIITNLSGMGKFFLMSEEELEEQAGHPSGAYTSSTGGMLGLSTVTDFEHIMKIADSYNYTDTTEEK